MPHKGTILVKEIMPDTVLYVEGYHNHTCERCHSKKDVYLFDCMGSQFEWLCYSCNCAEMELEQ